MTHLARADEAGERADALLDRHLRIDAMQVEQVDDVCSEPLKALVTRRRDRGRRPIRVDARTRTRRDDAAFGREDDVAAPGAERAADQRLVVPLAVNRGGVEERHAKVDRTMNRADRLLIVPDAVGLRHAHAAEANRRHVRAIFAEFSLLHRTSDVTPCVLIR